MFCNACSDMRSFAFGLLWMESSASRDCFFSTFNESQACLKEERGVVAPRDNPNRYFLF